MRPLARHSVNKKSSATRFKQHTRRTKSPNTAAAPMRGGWRL